MTTYYRRSVVDQMRMVAPERLRTIITSAQQQGNRSVIDLVGFGVERNQQGRIWSDGLFLGYRNIALSQLLAGCVVKTERCTSSC